MIRRLFVGLRFNFAKWKPAEHNLGGLDDLPDIKNIELDKARRLLNTVHLHHAGK